MNTGIVMIGLALILLSVAMMVAPATAIAVSDVSTSEYGNSGLIGEPFSVVSYANSASTDSTRIPISQKNQPYDPR